MNPPLASPFEGHAKRWAIEVMRILVTFLIVISVSCAGSRSTTAFRNSPRQAELVELELNLPGALFGPQPPRNHKQIPNLPREFLKTQDPLLVPKGTKLISKNKPVTCSDPRPIVGEPNQITDGIKEGGEEYSLFFGSGKQYVQIDLESEYTIFAIALWHEQYMNVYYDVVVQVSTNSLFKTDAKTIFNNDHDNSSEFGKGSDRCYCDTYRGKMIDAKGVVGRYVRIYCNGSAREDMNKLTEVEVYGIPKQRDAQQDKSSVRDKPRR